MDKIDILKEEDIGDIEQRIDDKISIMRVSNTDIILMNKINEIIRVINGLIESK